MRTVLLILSVFLLSCGQTFYVVRHAEKATPMGTSTDVPLNAAGEARALALAEVLRDKNIRAIYSTNTIRTRMTAKPTADHFNIPVEIYANPPDSSFIERVKSGKKNALVVGHSNTVDDISNMLCGKKVIPGDLADKDYDNLFVIRKRGKKFSFTNLKYGARVD